MKKIYFLSSVVLMTVIFFNNCAVNNFTGIISVENRTNTDLLNVRVGNTLIALLVLPGAKLDYYYYKTVYGNLTTSGVYIDNNSYFDLNGNGKKDSGEGVGEVTFSFKTNYWIKIYAYYSDSLDENLIGISNGEQNGTITSYREYIDY